MNKFILLFLIITTTFLNGCTSSKGDLFNDKDIKISLINHQSNNEFKSYVIEVKNEGKLEVKHLNFYLYYPIIQPNGFSGNPFKIEGETKSDKPINLKSGEKVMYTIFSPIKEVYGDSKLLDFNIPQVELNGFAIQEKKEIPFGMSGGYIGKIEN